MSSVDPCSMLQFATTAAFHLDRFQNAGGSHTLGYTKENMVVSEAPPKVWEWGSDLQEIFRWVDFQMGLRLCEACRTPAWCTQLVMCSLSSDMRPVVADR